MISTEFSFNKGENKDTDFRAEVERDLLKPIVVSQLLLHLSSNVKIYNSYGSSECGPVTFYRINFNDLHNMVVVPIGLSPSPDQCYLLDENRLPICEPNIVGEIYFSGPTLFRGYYGNPILTNKYFSTTANNTEKLLYRTGDMAKYDKFQNLVYVTRIDFQVKIRGQRIETGEVESCILDLSNEITNCVAVKSVNDYTGEECLVAYIEQKGSSIDQLKLKNYCRRCLPEYMIPTLFVPLVKIPVTNSGKVDRKSLPRPNFSPLLMQSTRRIEQYEMSEIELETKVHQIWCKVLNFTKVLRNQNFFDIGGNSILAIELYNQYETVFGENKLMQLDISVLFEHPTIAEQVKYLNNKFCHDNESHSMENEIQSLSTSRIQGMLVSRIQYIITTNIPKPSGVNRNHINKSVKNSLSLT
ncbi:unnamed protein product [Adineta ricciae]|uniref:Carrier domain-containing protein n=1 Tax=Adineta ricciae TaxID=249248 RepID=A0A813SE04_ADIRI|nr:unnamed protein product [Adineta ricciae]CAF1493659.1 unnamed protein product [Adineta ricciae]